jgi:hypothetical protein
MFVHCVYFWLNDGVPEEERRALMNDCEDMLAEIPTVRHIWSGVPADRPRPVVDSSYDVGLCVVFDDVKGHDVYQTHPIHDEFIKRHKQHWKRVQIYDHHRGTPAPKK